MKKYFPILNWLPNYKKSFLVGDISAGLTVGVMLIPQGMAYAMIAGLPPVYGLYASLVPQIIYSIFGTSRQLAVGPVAMDSLLVASGVSVLAVAGTEYYIALAILLAFLMGMIQFLSGVLRLGFLVNFLSKPVISGFTSAAALIIGFNQLKHLIGVELEKGNNVFLILFDAYNKIEYFNWISIAIGALSIVIILVSKRIHKSVPSALIAVVVGILIAWLFDLDVNVIGKIPEGLPEFKIPEWNMVQELLPMALTIALIAFMEAISVAKTLEGKHKGEYEVDNNQEMMALGLGNLIGAFFASYPTTGGFSRSAVSEQAGAKTNLAAIISALLIGLTLLFLTPLFYYLPKTVLGAIIIMAVLGLFDLRLPMSLWKNSKQDFFMLLGTFAVTLGFGIKEGIMVGVLLSIIALIYRTSRPHIAILGRLPNSNEYRNVSRFTDLEIRKDVLIIRHDAQLYFANSDHFRETLKSHINEKGKELKLVILHFGSVSSIDTTALQMLKDTIEYLNEQSIGVYFSDVIGPVRDFFYKTRFIDMVGENHFFVDVDAAVQYLEKGAKSRSKQMLRQALQNNVFKEKDI